MKNAISPETIYQIIDKNINFIDLRDPQQFEKLHIKNFVNIQPDQLFSYVSTLLPHEPICLICYSGKRTQELAKQLCQKGYQAYYIQGGFQAFLNLQNNQYY